MRADGIPIGSPVDVGKIPQREYDLRSWTDLNSGPGYRRIPADQVSGERKPFSLGMITDLLRALADLRPYDSATRLTLINVAQMSLGPVETRPNKQNGKQNASTFLNHCLHP